MSNSNDVEDAGGDPQPGALVSAVAGIGPAPMSADEAEGHLWSAEEAKAIDPPSAQAVIEDREASHGDYTKQAATSQALKNVMRGVRVLDDTKQESLEMIAVKISRILNGDPNNPDSWTDIAGYATLVANLLTKGTHL